jgi:hypothetical protein
VFIRANQEALSQSFAAPYSKRATTPVGRIPGREDLPAHARRGDGVPGGGRCGGGPRGLFPGGAPDVRAAAVVSQGPCRLQGPLPSTSRDLLGQDPWIGLALGTHPPPACSMNGAARVVPSLLNPWSESMMGRVRGTNRKNRERRPAAHQWPTRDRRSHARRGVVTRRSPWGEDRFESGRPD